MRPSLLGVSALRHKLIALVASAFFAGLAGGAFAFYHVSYYPQFPFAPVWTFDAVMMTYIGGVGTIVGPVIGAIFYVVVKEYLALNLVELHLIVFGVLFILVVLFLPGGLVEAWTKIRRMLPVEVESEGNGAFPHSLMGIGFCRSGPTAGEGRVPMHEAFAGSGFILILR